MVESMIQKFFKLESASGILLGLLSIAALIIVNSPAHIFYQELSAHFHLDFITNDGLMAIFFFLVGLEIKREIISGELNSTKKILLPAIAALFGMIFPALIYISVNYHHPELLRGWAIPTATDIAFTLAVLSLLKSRIPLSLKIFLTALAIFDDLGAIIIIAIFYAQHINIAYLLLSVAVCLTLILTHCRKSMPMMIYIILGILLWCCVFFSGIHPTIAGVLLALMIPAEKIPALEQKIHPYVAYFILPLFAFMNMGIPLEKVSLAMLSTSVPTGIILGLFLGKFIGIFLAVYLMIKLGFAKLPTKSTWRMMVGASFLCGIGFTMSLFIGDLAFDQSMINLVRTGVLCGSLLSGLCGYLILRTQ